MIDFFNSKKEENIETAIGASGWFNNLRACLNLHKKKS